MSRVLIDTNILVYLFEDEGVLGNRAKELFRRMHVRKYTVVVSTMTVGELLVKPKKDNASETISLYRNFFRSGLIDVVSFDESCSETFSDLRAMFSIKAPDAVQLSCAKAAGCTLMITNDQRLKNYHVEGIPLISSLENSPL